MLVWFGFALEDLRVGWLQVLTARSLDLDNAIDTILRHKASARRDTLADVWLWRVHC